LGKSIDLCPNTFVKKKGGEEETGDGGANQNSKQADVGTFGGQEVGLARSPAELSIKQKTEEFQEKE